MRSKQEIEDKFNELYFRRRKERRDKFLSRCPVNCKHNERHYVTGQGTVGFCTNKEVLRRSRRKVFVCDNKNTAEKCQHYECKNNVKSVEEDFDRIIRDPHLCGQEYPKLAVLIWFLQEVPRDAPEPSVDEGQEEYAKDNGKGGLLKLLGRVALAIWLVITFPFRTS